MISTIPQLTTLLPGDRCFLIADPDCTGTVIQVEDNLFSVMVQWDDLPSAAPDFQWANKLAHHYG